jgi:hypothetical protein
MLPLPDLRQAKPREPISDLDHKLERLRETASRKSGKPVLQKEFAFVWSKEIDGRELPLSPGRVTQIKSTGRLGYRIARTLQFFRGKKVILEEEWLYQNKEVFDAYLDHYNHETAEGEDWTIGETVSPTGLAKLTLYQPLRGNLRDRYYVEATLHLEPVRPDYVAPNEPPENVRTVFIGLREVLLSLHSHSYKPAKGSVMADRRHENFERPGPSGVRIIGPLFDGCLDGNPFDEDERILELEPNRSGDGSVTLQVTAGRFTRRNERNFKVYELGLDADRDDRDSAGAAPGKEEINKEAVLNALIYKMLEKDSHGHVILTSASMKRNPPE